MEEQFSGSCTLEIAAFDEFSRLLGDTSATAEFDHVLFDTAPTGHTLRLLTLPSAWSGFMKTNTTGTSCLGPLAGLQTQQDLYRQTVLALADPKLTTLVMVTRPEASSLREAARTSGELAALNVKNQHLVVNALFQATNRDDAVAVAMQKRGELALSNVPFALRDLPRTLVPLSRHGVLGVEALRSFGQIQPSGLDRVVERERVDIPLSLGALMDGLAAHRHGVIFTMGKGGVGKTTVAASIAMELARLGHQVLLTTTDPAAHVAATVASDIHPNISVSRIDPGTETARYSAEVMQTAGAGLDEHGKALLAEDLRSPCTEEIAVFRAFADAVAAGKDRFVVLDTAPTGHTILLLDAALAYHREVSRQASKMPESVEHLLPRLRDPEFTRVLIVTLPEATPVHEAGQLQKDLRRAGIEPYAWVINQSLAPLDVTDPILVERQRDEDKYIREVMDEEANRTALIAWQKDPPVGFEGLQRILDRERIKEAPAPVRRIRTAGMNWTT
jgi:arsenite-transporting ATPase